MRSPRGSFQFVDITAVAGAWKTIINIATPATVPIWIKEWSLSSKTSTAGHMRFRWVKATNAGTPGGSPQTVTIVPVTEAAALPSGITNTVGQSSNAAWSAEPTLDSPAIVRWQGYMNTGYGNLVYNPYWMSERAIYCAHSSFIALQMFSPTVEPEISGSVFLDW